MHTAHASFLRIAPFLLFAFCLLPFTFFLAPPAHACTPPPGGLPQFTPEERAAQAQLVLVGEVTAVSDGPGGIPGATAMIVVREYLKGDGPAQITIAGYGPSSLCRSPVAVGDVRVFYATGDGAGGWQAFYLSQFDATAPVDGGIIPTISAATGQAPAAPEGGAAGPGWIIWAVGGAALLILAGLGVWRARRPVS